MDSLGQAVSIGWELLSSSEKSHSRVVIMLFCMETAGKPCVGLGLPDIPSRQHTAEVCDTVPAKPKVTVHSRYIQDSILGSHGWERTRNLRNEGEGLQGFSPHLLCRARLWSKCTKQGALRSHHARLPW